MRKNEESIKRCKTMSTLQKILGGKWKLEILYYIGVENVQRFGSLRRHLGEITEQSSYENWKQMVLLTAMIFRKYRLMWNIR